VELVNLRIERSKQTLLCVGHSACKAVATAVKVDGLSGCVGPSEEEESCSSRGITRTVAGGEQQETELSVLTTFQ
jgi:hypothetical protein